MRILLPIGTISVDFVNGQRAFCPTGEGGGIDNSCGRGGGEVGSKWKNPSHKLASDMTGKPPSDDTPVKSYTMYHVTRVENVESIMENGFDLSKVKPRWRNDYAVSLNKGKQRALGYFTRRGEEFNESKYALLEVKIKGRYTQKPAPIDFSSNPQDYTRKIISNGWDGQNLGYQFYVHNPKSVVSIERISAKSE